MNKAKHFSLSRKGIWLFAIVLVLATIFAYQPAWNGSFVWDDDFYVTKNRLLTEPDGLRRIWFSLESPSQYFPLTYTSFRIERMLWGLTPTGYHWVNILLHTANALLLWRLLMELRVPGAWLAAAIFALHPVQVESVAWITERKNVLMAFFFLLALLAWTRFTDERSQRPSPQSRAHGKEPAKEATEAGKLNRLSWPFYWLALIFYLLALCSKATACTLPAALFLILWLQKKRIDWRRVLQIAPFIVLGIAMGLMTIWWERYHQFTLGPMFALGPLERLIVATHAVWFYLGELFWPAKLTFIYPQWTVDPHNPFSYVWLVSGIVLCAAIYFARRYVGRSVEVAAAFFVLTLSPVLGFIMLYTFRYTFVADHYQYLACIGPIALVSAGLVTLANSVKYGPRFLFALGILLLSTLGLLTWRQSASYRDSKTLWRTTIDRNPGCWMAETNLGSELSEEGDVTGAIAHLEKSLRLKFDAPEAHNGLTNALFRKGDADAAIAEAHVAMNFDPNNADTHAVLGMALMTKGQLDEAIAQLSKAIEILPDYSHAHYNLALALAEKGETVDAIAHYEKAIAAQPDLVEAVTNLAWIYATSSDANIRNGPKAVELGERASQLTRDTSPVVLRTLAAAYATNKSFDKAHETSRRALELAQEQRNSELAETIRREMSLYEAGLPYSAP
ncbi:MAG TPA: tetratricopeptide repeat protein [Candidatus Babeliales bacterium]|nr:tetratricopeptide repeat protein [Candidatus Babeliales bacterium]